MKQKILDFFKQFPFFFKTDTKSNPTYWKLEDKAIMASWDYHQGQLIGKAMQMCRNRDFDDVQAHNYFRDLDEACIRKWNDQKGGYTIYEPEAVTFKEDRLTDYGLSLFFGLILKKDLPGISHMGAGDGGGDTQSYQPLLYSERVRYAFVDNGYFDATGPTMQFRMRFDIDEESFTYKEIGLFDNGSANVGPLISRTTFDTPLDHVKGVQYNTASYLIIGLTT